MKKRFAAIFVVIALAFMSLGVAAVPALADELQTIKIDVSAENGSYNGYEINNDSILLLNTNVYYELSGDTERQVVASNADTPVGEFFYLRLNNVMLQGGITAQDQDNFFLCLDVPEGTISNVETLGALNLYIGGPGRLCAESLNVGPTSVDASTAGESFFAVVDTRVDVQRDENATKSCVWMGDAELSGNADVTYVSSGDYASLRVLNVGKRDNAVTIKDNAKLYCLQDELDEPSSTFVDGLQIVVGNLVLKDNAFLQAQGRPWSGGIDGEGGVAVLGGGGFEISENAQIIADSYGSAIIGDDMNVSGKNAYVSACSKDAVGIDLDGKLKVSGGARVDATGKLKAVSADGSLNLDGASLIVESETAGAVESKKDISFKNAIVAVTPASGFAAFSAEGDITIDGSLVVLPQSVELAGATTNSIVFVGNEGAVLGDATLLDNLVIDSGRILIVPADSSLTIPADKRLDILEGGTLINNGTICVLGAVDGKGTVVCNSHCGGTATCVSRAVCDVCRAEYGELDPFNHANLKHVSAVEATANTEGNIEYWFCESCGKYYADAAAKNEITQASTVIAKLSGQKSTQAEPGAGSNSGDNDDAKSVVNGKETKTQLSATGDSTGIILPLVAALASIVFLAGRCLCLRYK